MLTFWLSLYANTERKQFIGGSQGGVGGWGVKLSLLIELSSNEQNGRLSAAKVIL